MTRLNDEEGEGEEGLLQGLPQDRGLAQPNCAHDPSGCPGEVPSRPLTQAETEKSVGLGQPLADLLRSVPGALPTQSSFIFMSTWVGHTVTSNNLQMSKLKVGGGTREVGGLELTSSLGSCPRVGLLEAVSSGERSHGPVWESQPQRNRTKEKAEPISWRTTEGVRTALRGTSQDTSESQGCRQKVLCELRDKRMGSLKASREQRPGLSLQTRQYSWSVIEPSTSPCGYQGGFPELCSPPCP